MIDKHFKQCMCPKNLQLLAGSEERASHAFASWLKEENTENDVITCEFNKKALNSRAFVIFCADSIAPNDAKMHSLCA